MNTIKNKNNTFPFLKTKNSKLKTSGFTLVELIVVIVILAILATIAFLSFNSYASSARDSVRLADLVNIEKGLNLYSIKSSNYPIPEDYITLTASGDTNIIGYQGKAGSNILSMIKLSDGGKDPLDNTYYTYSINSTKTKYQLLGFKEAESSIAFVPTTYAIDYSKRTIITKGDSLGILLSTGTLDPLENQKINGFTGVDIFSTSTGYTAVFDNKEENRITGTGNILYIELSTSYMSNSKFPGCDHNDLIIGKYTLAACNVGSTKAGTGADSYGSFFKWGDNNGWDSSAPGNGFTIATQSGSYALFTKGVAGASTITNDWTITQPGDTVDSADNPSTRWNNIKSDKPQGPCPDTYHVPTSTEWNSIYTAGLTLWPTSDNARGTILSNKLLLPEAGSRNYSDGSLNDQGTSGIYWSSSPSTPTAYYLVFTAGYINPAYSSSRSYGFAVRCLKN